MFNTINRINKAMYSLRNVVNNLLQKSTQRDIDRDSMIKHWHSERGDHTHRLEYPLTSQSTVFDVGGYLGQWASDIFAKYQCKIFVFEPVKKYYKFIDKRFKDNKKIIPVHAGLGYIRRLERINVFNENSSIYEHGMSVEQQTEEIKIINIVDFVKKNHINKINLIKINIEGGEYELITGIIESGLVNIIDNLQIQFHSFVKNGAEERLILQKCLKKTHKLTYNYPFIWENWERK